MRLLKSAACSFMLLGFMQGCAHSDESVRAPARVAADIAFRCLWWSEQQMEGLNPNAPPPKNTEVTIRKWEYSDPVGVPHPDTVDVVVALSTDETIPVSGVTAELSGQWRIGPAAAAKKASWSEPRPLRSWPALTIVPGEPVLLRVPVNIAGRMAELERRKLWPWELRVVLTVRSAGGAKPLLTRQAALPIQPGD